MKKLRNKIIFILLATVLLPLVPLSFIVYNLVNQSYHVGVNPKVGEAIEYGLSFSKDFYNLQRKELALALDRIAESPKLASAVGSLSLPDLGVDTSVWKIRLVGLFDSQGNPLELKSFSSAEAEPIDPLIFRQFRTPEQKHLVASDREKNRFTAVRKVSRSRTQPRYLLLRASLAPEVLRLSEHILETYQMYQALDLARHRLPANFLLAFVVLALILVVLVVLVGIWISARITAPLSLLARGTAQIGTGNLDYRLPGENRKDEIGDLVRRFNQMAQELKSNQEKLIYLEKKAAWQQMARKLAHEIKNPLTPIQLTTQQLLDKYDNSNPDYSRLLKECYGIISEEIESLRRLVREFSEFGRMPELHLREGNVNELVRELANLFGDRLVLKLDESLPVFPFDQDRLRRVLINLVQNAIQADPDGKPVVVETGYSNGKILLTVADRGAGIPPEQIGKIFDPYFSTKKEGMGLGLAITRMIVEEHGGRIWVESKVNEGSKFYIEFTP